MIARLFLGTWEDKFGVLAGKKLEKRDAECGGSLKKAHAPGQLTRNFHCTMRLLV
jgi:hypothetical protein